MTTRRFGSSQRRAFWACAFSGLVFCTATLKAEKSPTPGAPHRELMQAHPNDPYFNQQWPLHGTDTGDTASNSREAFDHAHVAEAWQLIVDLGLAERAEDIGKNVRLAVVDDGFDLLHEELSSKIHAARNFGDPVPEGNLFRTEPTRDYHGTLVAGVAAASTDNGLGISGVCPGCQLVVARMNKAGAPGVAEQSYPAIFSWLLEQNADVINCSWGPSDTVAAGHFDALIEAITTTSRTGRGTALVFAAGNRGENLRWNAFATHPSTLVVGASDRTGKRHNFSDFGDGLDLLAPASATSSNDGNASADLTWSTDNYQNICGSAANAECRDPAGLNPSSFSPGGDDVGKYSSRFGRTSAAAPLVSGIIGLMLHVNPELTATQISEVLHHTADRISAQDAAYGPSGHSKTYGYGRVNALRAVARAYELTGRTLSDEVKAKIDSAVPCTRRSCWDGGQSKAHNDGVEGCSVAHAPAGSSAMFVCAVIAAVASRVRRRRTRGKCACSG